MRLPLRQGTALALVAGAAAIAVGIALFPAGASAAVSYLILGRTNYTAAQTNINNTAGTPLGLYAKSGYAPMYVNSTKQVARLNADYVDGYHASALAKVNSKTGIVPATDAGAVCPTGTIATGGGGSVYKLNADNTITDIPTYYSGPDWNTTTGALIPNSWIVLPDSVNAKDVNVHFDVYVVCYKPAGGSIPGSITVLPGAAATKAALTQARAAVR
ncbi:MAG: hypothetical protein ACXV3F_04455 [Frankiaceae bacterium]